MSTEHRKLAVIGQGYVGLPLAMRAVGAGYRVVGYDIDKDRIERLEAGRTFVDDVADDEIAAALASGRYLPSTRTEDLADFDIAVITVPTPLRDGAPDLSYIDAAGTALGERLRPGATVILESTTYPGTTEERLRTILEEASGLHSPADFHLGYSPERIDPGNAVWTLEKTPKVVSGVDEASLKVIRSFYDSVVETTVPVSNARTAELTKLVENTFRHVNIALVNELAMYADDLDINIWEVLEAADSKPFGYMRFNPGPGVGGHCLPIDPSYLSWQVKRRLGATFRFVELANDINEHMPTYVVQRVTQTLNRRRTAVNGSRILILGLAYKRDSGDARESPALPLARQLDGLGAHVRASDPHITEPLPECPVVLVEPTDEEIRLADLVLIVTDHTGFPYDRLIDLEAVVLDTRNVIDGEHVEHL